MSLLQAPYAAPRAHNSLPYLQRRLAGAAPCVRLPPPPRSISGLAAGSRSVLTSRKDLVAATWQLELVAPCSKRRCTRPPARSGAALQPGPGSGTAAGSGPGTVHLWAGSPRQTLTGLEDSDGGDQHAAGQFAAFWQQAVAARRAAAGSYPTLRGWQAALCP